MGIPVLFWKQKPGFSLPGKWNALVEKPGFSSPHFECAFSVRAVATLRSRVIC